MDVLIDRGRELLPLEVKAGETFQQDFLREIGYWRALAGAEAGPASLVHAGPNSYRRDGTTIYSWWGF